MDLSNLPDNPYLLLTPGPLSTTKSVKAAMLRDWCTWDDDYNSIVQEIRAELVKLATARDGYTSVLMQGSGSFSVEAVLGSVIPQDGHLLVPSNGAYGRRIVQMAERMGIHTTMLDSGETRPTDLEALETTLQKKTTITHVALVHCETTTGMLNPTKEAGAIVKAHGKTFILDAMSSFAGMEMDQADVGADFLISSANKCIQGVPGFGFVIARRGARSVSLDLYDQWRVMEEQKGKWRFTSPTHVVRAFRQALLELQEEGGIPARAKRYAANHRTVVDGLRGLGFQTLLPDEWQSPIITTFLHPQSPDFTFKRFYDLLKEKGFVIYPGKVSEADTFRIGHIGHVFPEDMERLVQAIKASMYWA